MVNKVLVALSVVVMVSAVGIGVLVGTQLTGDSGAGPISGPENGGESGTEPATETRTMSEQQTDVPARQFSESAIAANVTELVNEKRRNKGLEPLSTSGNTAAKLQSMAQGHSETMASTGEVATNISNVSSADRYRNYGLYEQCKINRNNNYLIYPDNAAFEAVGETVAGQQYSDGDQTEFNGDERAVAQSVVDQWVSYGIFNDRLTYDETSRMGIGVSVGRDSAVYVTVNVCA